MVKFFVGMRVRLVKAKDTTNIGCEGRITHIGEWLRGDIMPIGVLWQGDGGMNLIIIWDRILNYGNQRAQHGPCRSECVEPILPEGAAPSIYSYQELMDKLGEGEKV